nr:tetratricopeptide repeat protein [Azospirillum soli]
MLDAAIDHHRAGRLAEAQALYDHILALAPAHADVLHLSGLAAHQAGQSGRAVGWISAALAVHPAFAAACNSLGNAFAAQGRLEEAVAAYRRAITLQDGDAEVFGNLGKALEGVGRYGEAVAAYDDALARDPGLAGVRHDLGCIYRRAGRNDLAAVCFHEVVKAVPSYAPAWRNLALSLRALRHADAELCLRQALASTPADAELAIELTNLLHEQGRAAEAEAVLEAAVAADPSSALLQFTLGRVLQAQGRWADAVSRYRLSLAADPGLTAARNNIGVALLDLGVFDAAIVALRGGIAVQPDDAVAFSNLGTAYDGLRRLDEAAVSYRRALALQPDYGKALNNLGNVHKALRRLGPAIRLYRMAIAAQPDYSDSYTNLGAGLQEVDRVPEAERVHRRAVLLNPGSAVARTSWGLALQVIGRMGEAEAAHRAALTADDQHAEANANLGMLFWQTGRADLAEAPLQRALDLDPTLAAAHLNLGLVRLAKGKLAEGWKSYQWRFRAKGYENRAIAAPLWEGEAMAGKRLLVWREQGVGDEIFFASCFPDLARRVGGLVIECDRRFVSLFARSFPSATVRAESVAPDGRETIVPLDCDAHIPAGSLPRLLRGAVAAFDAPGPWLVPDPARVALWRERVAALGPGLTVGIGWRSQLMTMERRSAYTTLEQWGPLFAVPGVVFVNLQYGDCAAELDAAEARFGVRIHRWADLDLKDDFEAAAALTANLDLVITPAMSAGELAGALGVPVWRFGHRDWTQLGSGVRPWFPSMRLFQPRPGETFDDVLARMARALDQARVVASRPPPPKPQSVEPLVADAIARYRAGDLDKAARLCHSALDRVSDHAVALHLLGVMALRRNDAQEATGFLVRATASEPSNAAAHAALSNALQALGRYDAAEAALRHAAAAQPDAAEHWVNRTALLRGFGRDREAESCVRRALRLRPDLGLAHTHLGNLLAGRGEAAGAALCHRRALVLAASGVDALINLGSAFQASERFVEAARVLRRATVLDPGAVAAWTNLGNALDSLGRHGEAYACHRMAVERAPGMAEAHANLAMHWNRQGRREEAAEAYLQALQADPQFAQAHYNLALLLLESGILRQGWAEHEWRFGTPQFQGQERALSARAWRGENIASSRLLVWREQGVGDEILFASCYPDLLQRAGHLVIECDRRLVTLFARSFPGATVRSETANPRDADVHVAAGSLPRLLRSDLKRFPERPSWLVPDPERVAVWRERVAALGPGLTVGIGWRSQLMTMERRSAYTTLEQWGPLFAVPGVVFVNLQYGDCAAELDTAEARFGVRIHRWADLDLKDDFEAAAALTANLDLVITPAMSAGELAGALGVPVWRLGHRDWTQLGSGVRPWFPSMRLFQPRTGETFDDVLARMAALLSNGSASTPEGKQEPAPVDPDALLEAAADHHRTGRLGEAAPLYEQVLAVRPDDPVALHLSGLLAHQTGASEAGAARIAQAIGHLPGYAAAQTSLGTVLLSLGRPIPAAERFRRALALQPSSAAALTNLGNALEASYDLPAAAVAHRRAAAAEPALAEAHDNWGAVLSRLGHPEAAELLHRQALSLAPAHLSGWLNLGIALRRSGRLGTALAALRRALALDPALADGLANLGRLLREMADPDEAAVWCDRALAVEPGHPAASFNRGLLRLAVGDLDRGWTGYDSRFSARELAGAARVPGVPAWAGEDLSGRRLLVWREQGIGDEIMFADCLPQVIARAASVTVECDRRLVPLFARSFPAAIVRPSPTDPEVPCPGIDLHAAMGSLPRWLRRTLGEFPVRSAFLVPDPKLVRFWRDRLNALEPGLKVGIAWRSGLMTAERRRAYAALDQWGPVFGVPGIAFVNLQYGDCAQEIEDAEARFGVPIHGWPDLDLKDDLEAVAALISGLDLVIVPASSVGELAGALGVPVWRFGGRGDWTALGTGVRPWFSSMSLITAPDGETASGALPVIARRLKRLAAG